MNIIRIGLGGGGWILNGMVPPLTPANSTFSKPYLFW